MLVDVTYSYKLKYKTEENLIQNKKNLVAKIRYKTIFSRFTKTTYIYLVDDIRSDRELEEFFEMYDEEAIKRMVERKINNELRHSIRKETINGRIERFNKNSKSTAKMLHELQ